MNTNFFTRLFLLGLFLGVLLFSVPVQSVEPEKKSGPKNNKIIIENPIMTHRADPWVIRDGDRFLWCFTEGGPEIAIYESETPFRPEKKHVIWRAPEKGMYSKEIWAPELHHLDDRWYVYFAASNGKNKNHRTYVLRSKTDHPFEEYEILGPLYTGDDFTGKTNNRWAIDMTVLEYHDQRYAVWSGWQGTADEQHLFIAPMENPWTLAAARVRLCSNDDFAWERTNNTPPSRGLSEGPQVLQWKDRTFIVYSCGASWLPTYKLGLLELVGKDPLKPEDWKKYPEPVFQGTPSVHGPGHASFLAAPTRSEPSRHWILYHAKRTTEPGWLRDIFIQPFHFNETGLPVFGPPLGQGTLEWEE